MVVWLTFQSPWRTGVEELPCRYWLSLAIAERLATALSPLHGCWKPREEPSFLDVTGSD